MSLPHPSPSDVLEFQRWAAWIEVDPAAVADLCQAFAASSDQIARDRARLLAGELPEAGSTPRSAACAAVLAVASMRERHQQAGIPEPVIQATARDIALWITEHHRQHGDWGLSETGWIRHHLGGRLLSLGRLQFMLAACTLPLRPTDPLGAGDPIIEIHIPAGAPLDPAACQKSLAMARGLYAGRDWCGFTCQSWLLGPRLGEILPPESNILTFQRWFHPLPCAMDDRQAIERIFGTWPLDPARAPQTTRLQRAVLAFYAAGGRLDGGAGFIAR